MTQYTYYATHLEAAKVLDFLPDNLDFLWEPWADGHVFTKGWMAEHAGRKATFYGKITVERRLTPAEIKSARLWPADLREWAEYRAFCNLGPGWADRVEQEFRAGREELERMTGWGDEVAEIVLVLMDTEEPHA